jgi:2-polyprenyl-3-methyl-5-hydroxy-6-metoxy-1,4-benzoquinol methylase
MDNQLLYDREIPTRYEDLNNEHKKVLKWVGENKRVLEVACHTGYFSAWLKRQGCEVTGAEIYEPALEKAKPYLAKWVLGNIETDEVWELVSEDKYDVVLYMHILEHLINPEEILMKTLQILNPNGHVVICLPNISNSVNRWEMFRGNFTYTETGVMDRTHLRFYNYYTAAAMIQRSGFKIEEYHGYSAKITYDLFTNKLLRRVRGISRLNWIFNKIIHKSFSPNFTDKILMFKVVAA